MVRDDLSLTQKDKITLQAKVTELKNSMKTLLQQNQQLKLDLKHGKMKKVLKKHNLHLYFILFLENTIILVLS